MCSHVNIEPMSEAFILWRCLHSGPISAQTIERCPPDTEVDWKHCRLRNIPLLVKLIRTYGSCAFLALDGDLVVGQLRFYPRVVQKMSGADGFCLQQKFPAGPPVDFGASDHPPLEKIDDKTLTVHCLMTGSPLQTDNPHQRKGIGSRMVKALIRWAGEQGWRRIEADAFEDLPLVYEVTGSAGIEFWSKIGFHIAGRHPHPYLQQPSEFSETLEAQAKAQGISPDRAKDRIVMRLDL